MSFFILLHSHNAGMKAENSHMRLKLAKLARDCAERVVEYCNQPGENVPMDLYIYIMRNFH